MSAPIKSAEEISLIINRGQHAIADIGLSLVRRSKRGQDQGDTAYRDDMYRLILLRIYLQNILDDDGEVIAYYEDPANEQKFNKLLDAIARLSQFYGGAAIPLLTGKRIPLAFFPSTAGSTGAPVTGGPAVPGGVTFQNINVQSPGEVVDSLDASSSEYAFYIINIRGTGTGEGSRLDILGINWRGSSDPVITNYRGNDVGGTVGDAVNFSAAIVGGNLELTCNVPTNGWVVRGSRISFENVSFQNAQGPLPAGGTVGQYLRKSSSNDFDAQFADVLMAEVIGLVAALGEKLSRDGSIPMNGNLPAGGNKITGLGVGTGNGDSLRYEQVIGVFLQLIGGTMSGSIAMGGNKVTGLAAATNNGDAVRYEQLIAIPQEAWIDITLINGWVSGSVTPQYFKDSLGAVHFRGDVDGTDATNAIFANLPAGYRPTQQTQSNVVDASIAFFAETNGDIKLFGFTAATYVISDVEFWTH
jgi:hypothetical protein